MGESLNWPREFAEVVTCKACSPTNSLRLLRDDIRNVPQPGYVGRSYERYRVLLIGQNPAVSERFPEEDDAYTSALLALSRKPDKANYMRVGALLDTFIPKWPVHGNYFPLAECGLNLEDIAYFNAVRCRTVKNALPDSQMTFKCVRTHLSRWLDLLAPSVVVFVGKWASEKAASEVSDRGISSGFMNRHRSLSAEQRRENREAIVTLVRASMANPSFQCTARPPLN